MAAPVLLAADFDYDDAARAAKGGVVAFEDWAAEEPLWTDTITIESIEPYEPGSFYKRELPCWLRALERARERSLEPDILVVDGYADFGIGEARIALGVHLHRATGKVVVGVGKTEFRGAAHVPVLRGASARPLFVTAVGMSADDAARCVRSMRGPNRMPMLLALADALARGHAMPTRR